MSDRNYSAETHADEMLSGYLDGELTQQMRQRVEVHLENCAACRENLADLESLRNRMGQAGIGSADQDKWREMMNDTTVIVSRGIGWLLFVGALLILFGIGVVAFWTESSEHWFLKLLVTSVYAGLGALFVSVLRQRLIERKTDKYKDVEI